MLVMVIVFVIGTMVSNCCCNINNTNNLSKGAKWDHPLISDRPLNGAIVISLQPPASISCIFLKLPILISMDSTYMLVFFMIATYSLALYGVHSSTNLTPNSFILTFLTTNFH